MATTAKKTAIKPKKTLSKKSFGTENDAVHNVLKEIEHQAKHSASLYKQGAIDSFSAYFNQLLTNPLPTLFASHKKSEELLRTVLHSLAMGGLSVYRKNIEAVYRLSEKDLYYFIILKEDTATFRALMYRFVEWYESNNQLDIDTERFPLHLHFVSSDLTSELQRYEKVSL